MPVTPQVAYYEDQDLVNETFEIDLQSNVHLQKKDHSGKVICRRKDVIHQKIHVLPPVKHSNDHKPLKSSNIPEPKITITKNTGTSQQALQRIFNSPIKQEDKSVLVSRIDMTTFGTQTLDKNIDPGLNQKAKSCDSFTDSFLQTFLETKDNKEQVMLSSNDLKLSVYTGTPSFKELPGVSVMVGPRSRKNTHNKTKLKQIYPGETSINARFNPHPDFNKKFEEEKIKSRKTFVANFSQMKHSKSSAIIKNKEGRSEAQKEFDRLMPNTEIEHILKSTSSFNSFLHQCQKSFKSKETQKNKKIRKFSDLSYTSTIDLESLGSRHKELKEFLRNAFDEICS